MAALSVKFGAFFFCGVDMPDAGASGTPPQDRRYGQADFVKVYGDLEAYAQTADRLEFDSLWLAEHHFQYEGYEVVPNAVLMAAFLAARTTRLRFGAMFNVLPQWHPLRFAEDFALADVMTGGRMICGIGRGTVPREAEPLGISVGWNNDADDVHNREVFEEQVKILKLAWHNETFHFDGKHYQLPPQKIDDRGRGVQTLTLIPKPLNTPVEIWQPVTSPPTADYVARERHKAVFWYQNRGLLKRSWEQYAKLVERYHGVRLRKGEDRQAVLNIAIADTREAAMRLARPGHDEFWRFLGPYGWSKAYVDEQGKSWVYGRIPTLEESIAQGAWLVGTADEVGEEIAGLQADLGLEYMTLFPHFPGMVREQAIEQLERFSRDIKPGLLRAAVPASIGA
ncbi:MAG TPA: LLM class flavin-dependent oxidoreductase [Chloroflexota bacterium]|nr:LLM class flavin-dependent oxidoreductase [Chloroflexota bacterium]